MCRPAFPARSQLRAPAARVCGALTRCSSLPLQVVSTNDLVAAQQQAIAQVQAVLEGLADSTARSLLIAFHWHLDNLFNALADRGQEELLRRVGARGGSLEAQAAQPSGDPVACPCCLCHVSPAQATAMPGCGHTSCNPCWRQHLRVRVLEACGGSALVPCVAFRCPSACDEDTVRRLLAGDPQQAEVLARFEAALAHSWVDDNAHVAWCPSVPHCGRAVEVPGEPYEEPQCECGTEFCFACGGPPHAPATCAHAAAWRLKCADGSETVTWVAAHTKPCPKCAKPIEKAGGCNLVQCPCGTCICWLCGAQTGREHTWTTIAEHTCGRWRQEKESAAAAAAAQLQRWVHFYDRHEAQRHSAQLEAKTLTASMARIEELESGTFKGSRAAGGGAQAAFLHEWSFVTAGARQLAVTRRVLACCAIFSFFFFAPRPAAAAPEGSEGDGEAAASGAAALLPLSGPQSCSLCDWSETEVTLRANLFDDHRESLEATAEQLSQALGVSPELMTGDSRARVVNLTALCGTRCANLYDIVENDLLGQLQGVTAHIAAYRPRGLQQVRCAMAQQAHLQQQQQQQQAQWEEGTSAGTSGAHLSQQQQPAQAKRKRHGHSGQGAAADSADAAAAMAVDVAE